MASSALTWALWFAKQGFLIAPLGEGSKRPPRGQRWKDRRTSDPDQIKAWFTDSPDMNYLVNPGSRYGIVDLDVKDDKDGVSAFAALETENGTAETLTVQSPSGGQHRFYRVPEIIGNSHTLPAGIDVRGEGGYVVGPGSRLDDRDGDGSSGEYSVLHRRAIASAPPWLLALLRPARSRANNASDPMYELDLPFAIDRAEEFLRKRRPAVEGHGGNEHTYVTFIHLRDFGISLEKALDMVLEPGGWNARCEPPWTAEEILSPAENAYRYAKSRPGSKGGGLMERMAEEMDMVDISTMDFSKEEKETEEEEYADLLPFVLQGEDIWRADTYQRFIIPEWIPDSGYVGLLAKRGVGKTTVMVDLASRIVLDMDWHGWSILPGYHVIYFCGEHDKVALQLFRAWREHNLGMDVAASGRLIFLRHASDLMSADKTARWAKFLRSRIGPHGRAVTFTDTWQRATTHGRQNEDADMQAATHNYEGFCRAMGGPGVSAFHPPKADSDIVLGSSVIENNSAAILTLTNEAQGKKLEVTRMKGKGEGNTMIMSFREIPFGEEDEHGREMSGQAVDRIGGTAPSSDGTGPMEGQYSASEVLDKKREAFAAVFVIYLKHIRSTDGKAKAKPDLKTIATKLSDLTKAYGTDMAGAEKEMVEAGGEDMFGISRGERKFSDEIRSCFIAPYRACTVHVDGEDWDVSLKKAGRGYQLQVIRAYKGS